MKKPKIVFFGNERLATAVDTNVSVLRSLVQQGYKVQAVISNFSPARSRNVKALEIVEVAHAYHIPVLLPKKLSKITSEIKKMNAEAAVLIAYGQIIPTSILEIFPKGIINLHPSLLPKYRGPTPVETTILDGAPETGISLMKLEPKMDAGPIYAQESIKLNQNETKQELADKLLALGTKLLTATLPEILSGKISPRPQNDKNTSYTRLLTKKDGAISWGESAIVIERKVRAFAGFPKTYGKINNKDVIITKVRVAKNQTDGTLVVRTNPGWLEILELVAPSGKTVTGREFLRGYSQ